MASVAIAVGVSLLSAALTAALTPPPEGSNQLDDLSVLKSEYGVNIPRIWGSHRVTGNVIWSAPLIEEQEYVRGDNNDIYTYFGDFAVMLADGLGANTSPFARIGKIWLNNKLVYNPNSDSSEVRAASERFKDRHLRFYLGTDTQTPDPIIEIYEGTGNVPAFKNKVYMTFSRLPLEQYGNIIPKVEVEYQANYFGARLNDIIEDLCRMAGLQSNQFSIEITENVLIKGFKFAQNGDSIRKALEDLQTVYFFQIIDDGSTLVFRDQIQPVDPLTPIISSNNLTTRLFGSPVVTEFTEIVDKQEDLPSQVELEYGNANNDYERGIQSRLRSNATHTNEVNLKTNVAMIDSDAQTTASRMLSLYWEQQKKFENLMLPLTFFNLVAGDTVRLRVRDTIRECQVQKITRGTNFVAEANVLSSPGNLYSITEVAATDDVYAPLDEIDREGDPFPIVIDAPLLKDNHSEEGYYGSAIQRDESLDWSGGAMAVSLNGDPFGIENSIQARTATQGTISIDTGISRGNVILNSKLTVVTTHGDLDSATPTQFENLDFAIWVNGEIIAYESANLIGIDVSGNNVYELVNIVRGIRGTESFIDNHQAGDVFYQIGGNNALQDFELLDIPVNSMLEFKAIPRGFSEDDITEILEVNPYEATRYRPYSPTNAILSRNPVNNELTLTWERRTRVGGDWKEFTEEVALSEFSESYEVELFSDGGGILRATIQGLSDSVIILSEIDQLEIFGSVKTAIRAKIYQVSATAGKGIPLDTGLLSYRHTY